MIAHMNIEADSNSRHVMRLQKRNRRLQEELETLKKDKSDMDDIVERLYSRVSKKQKEHHGQ